MRREAREERARRRFASFVERRGACLIWRGGLDGDGYGKFFYDGRTQRAHRVAASWKLGAAIPASLLVLYSCDTPACVEPSHLSVGTQAENLADAYRKGRKNDRGESNRCSKLTATAIQAIRARYAVGETQTALAAAFQVHQTHVSDIVNRVCWKHVA